MLRRQAYAIAYFIIRFSTDADDFFWFWFSGYLCTLQAICFGTLIAFMLPSHQVMMIFFGLSQNFWWLFNGVFVQCELPFACPSRAISMPYFC